jgi:PAS domain S-box-containing protein
VSAAEYKGGEVDVLLLKSLAQGLIQSRDLSSLLSFAAKEIGFACGASRSFALPSPALARQFAQPPIEWSQDEIPYQQEDLLFALLEHAYEAVAHRVEPVVVRAGGFDESSTRPEQSSLELLSRVIAELGFSKIVLQVARENGIPHALLILAYDSAREVSIEQTVFALDFLSPFLGVAVRNSLNNERLPHSTLESLRDEELVSTGDQTVQRELESDLLRITFSSDGSLQNISAAFHELTNYADPKLIGSDFSAFLSRSVASSDLARVERVYSHVFQGERRASLEYRMKVADGVLIDVVDQLRRSDDGVIESIRLPRATEVVAVGDTEGPADADERYKRLVEHSDAILFHVNADHVINFISRRALDFFGVPPEDFLAGESVRWFDLVHLSDRERVRGYAESMGETNGSFDEEFRVVNHISGRVRWVLTKFVPVVDAMGVTIGWDGFGIDITARKEAQRALEAQSKKVRALYTVSSAIRGYLDPANIASRGLAALCDATGADAALCYLYPSKESDTLSLVAHHGFADNFAERIEEASTLPSLSTYVSEHGQSVVVPDMRTDPRASRLLAEHEGLRSAVLVPISVEEETLGTIGLFHRDIAQFDGGDVMLVAAAANQIGLAARQADLFSAYRRQTKNLAALYRLSHELSGFLSTEEIFQKSFSIIRDELGLRRLWLGLLNETGTRIIGQAAYGPGWKKRLVEINVEISGRDHPIAQVVLDRKAVIIDDPEEVLKEFGVKRFVSRFSIDSVGLVPLISGGQVLGVLVFQPGAEDSHLDQEELTLLSSLASEIASRVLAKRLEERIGSSEKMRTAGLLAAGIAHNFNNLLQAILGQASLLEMQSDNKQQVSRAASIINDSATKGASLVKQLLSFANLEEPSAEVCDINAVIERSGASFKRILADSQNLEFELADSLPRAFVDPRQVMRVLESLVRNAREAMGISGEVQIFTDSITIDRKSPHFEVPYGKYIRIGVRDNGIGMNAEEKKRCFEPFFTTKDVDPSSGLSMSGAGLGLAAAFALARKNGGRLVADSRKGHGSVFTLYVPVAPEVSNPLDADELGAVVESAAVETSQSMKRNSGNLRLVGSSGLQAEVEKSKTPANQPINSRSAVKSRKPSTRKT